MSATDEKLLLELAAASEKYRRENRLEFYRPYTKQREFHAAGATERERLLLAGNQLGKTWSAGAEIAMHLTGKYPDWWEGRRFDRPVNVWASGITSETTRDNPQNILYGKMDAPGTGMIPACDILDKTLKRGVSGAIDTISVRHVSGGVSRVGFKSNDQGREKYQGPTLDVIWLDEEHDEDVYTECLTRTNIVLGPILFTFTPLKGMTAVVKRYLLDKSPGTHVTRMTIADAEHYTPEQRAAIIASYPVHERKARANGEPTSGSGVVFPIDEDIIKVQAFDIPPHWVEIAGIDFGWDHPSGAARIAWDRDNDVIYVTNCYRAREQTPAMFAGSVRPWGDWLKWSWPHDGLQHDKGSGEQLASQYRANGLNLLGERATFDDGTNGLEAGVFDMFDRMQTGRLKVFAHLNDWFEEFRLYHRKDGIIVKLNDDILSATRYAIMMKRHACTRVKKQQHRAGFGGTGWTG